MPWGQRSTRRPQARSWPRLRHRLNRKLKGPDRERRWNPSASGYCGSSTLARPWLHGRRKGARLLWMGAPEIRYTRNGDIHIVHTVFGESSDLVIAPGFSSHPEGHVGGAVGGCVPRAARAIPAPPRPPAGRGVTPAARMGRRVLEILCAAHLSAATRSPVSIPFEGPRDLTPYDLLHQHR